MRRKQIVLVLTALLVWAQFIPAALITAQEVSTHSQVVEASDSADTSEEDEDKESENIADHTPQDEEESIFSDQSVEFDLSEANSSVTESADFATQTTSAPDDIKTGDATASATVQNELNTNSVGEDNFKTIISVDEKTNPQDLDLSQYQLLCPIQYEFLSSNPETEEVLEIVNDASLQNNIAVSADTGGNNSEAGSIETGSATAQINLANVVNTNLIGNCWYFGIFNFFKEYSGDVILPYEGSIVGSSANQPRYEASDSVEISQTIETDNEIELANQLEASADTGENELDGGSKEIETGEAQTKIQAIDKINTNIYGNNWLLIEIINPQYWQGTFEGYEPQFFSFEDSLFFWMPPTNGSKSIEAETLAFHNQISIQNYAEIENNLSTRANTGSNRSEGTNTKIATGDALSRINILNYINTNIIGNNWYYTAFNLFEPFTGNIIFPRAELIAVLKADKKHINPGEMVLVTLNYANQGRLIATDSTAKLEIPDGFIVIDSSTGSAYSDNFISWQLGNLASGSKGIRQVLLQADPELDKPINITLRGRLSTSTLEGDMRHNLSSLALGILIPQSVGGVLIPSQNEVLAETSKTESLIEFTPVPVSAPFNLSQISFGQDRIIVGEVLAAETYPLAYEPEIASDPNQMCYLHELVEKADQNIWNLLLTVFQRLFSLNFSY